MDARCSHSGIGPIPTVGGGRLTLRTTPLCDVVPVMSPLAMANAMATVSKGSMDVPLSSGRLRANHILREI